LKILGRPSRRHFGERRRIALFGVADDPSRIPLRLSGQHLQNCNLKTHAQYLIKQKAALRTIGGGFSITQYRRPVKAMIRVTVIGKQQVDELEKA
jgi:hypothetical protein